MLINLFECTGSKIKVLFIKILIEQVKEQRNFIWSLERLEECVWRNVSEEVRLEKRVWRSAPEDTSSEARSSEASRQKLLHQSWQSTVYEVYNHELCNHHLCNIVSTSRQE